MYTGRVLYVGVNAPSSGMESDALLEGFQNSIGMHKVLYKELIADGDANAFKRLSTNDVYKDFDLIPERIRCYNHLQRNLYNQ
ncbi:hypothetical protein TKK_0002943 [Trichogramma kaykai]